MFEYRSIKEKKFWKYVKKRYISLRNRYPISPEHMGFISIHSLVYSIMIFENYNRPPILRLLEYIIFTCRVVLGKKRIMSLGIMQIKVDHLICNKQSILLAIDYIRLASEHAHKQQMTDTERILYIARKYNNSTTYSQQILKIYTYIETELVGHDK